MRIKFYCCSLLIIFSLNNLSAQAWQISYGGDHKDEAEGLFETKDGGFLFCGRTYSNTEDPSVIDNAFAAKTDRYGNLLWTYQHNTSYRSKAYDIIEAKNGEVILIGDVLIDPDGFHMFIIRLDKDGNHISTRIVEELGYGSGFKIISTKDGGFAIGGALSQRNCEGSILAVAWEFLIVKLDKEFNIEWSNCIGDYSNDFLSDIIETEDNDFIIIGNGATERPRPADIWVVKFKGENGDIDWVKNFIGYEYHFGKSVIELQNKDLLISGGWNQGDSLYVFRLESTGEPIWKKFYTTPGNITEREGYLKERWDGTFSLVSGKKGDIIITNIDENGEVLSINPIGKIGLEIFENPTSVILTSGGGLAICGSVINTIEGRRPDALLMRTDSNYITSTKNNIENNSIQIYPNPFRDFTTLKIIDEQSLIGNNRIEVYSLQGKLMYQSLLNTHEHRIDGKHFLPGIYIYKVENENGQIYQGKILKY